MKRVMAIIWVVLLACMLHVSAEEVATSGKCGESATWSYADGVLTISGSGEMDIAEFRKVPSLFPKLPWLEWRSEIETVVIDEGITRISRGAFWECSNITEIKLPSSLTEISGYMFYSCTSLERISIPDKVTIIGAYAFYDCDSLKEIEISEGVTEIGANAFEKCNTLAGINLPKSVAEIGANAFLDCSCLEKIELPSGVTRIGKGAFENCTSLKEFKIPEGYNRVEWSLFKNCNSLKKVILPETVKSIDTQAFAGCSALEDINLKYIEYVDLHAFHGCKSLGTVKFEYLEQLCVGAFDNCGELTVYLPPQAEKIAEESFEGDTMPVVYARPGTVAYAWAVRKGYGVHEAYTLNVGDVVDEIVDSDIYVTLNGKIIPSYCVDGRTLILMRDLERYGFDVRFDDENKIAYAEFNPVKNTYEGEAVTLLDKNVLYTDIRGIVNGVEVEVRNTNGYIAIEAERLGNCVPKISCVWQGDKRRLQMKVFEEMASFDDMVNAISERQGIADNGECSNYADTDNGRYDEFVARGYIQSSDYAEYVYPMRGLRISDFILTTGRVYFGKKYYDDVPETIKTEIPYYMKRYVKLMYEKGVFLPDENGEIYLDEILSKEQMEKYLDKLDELPPEPTPEPTAEPTPTPEPTPIPSRNALNESRKLHMSVTVNDKVYVIGGINEDDKPINNMEVCSGFRSNSWSYECTSEYILENAAAAVKDSTIYVIGGRKNGKSVNTINAYDTDTKQWSRVGSVGAPIESAKAVYLDNKLYITSSEELKSIVVYDIEKRKTSSMACPDELYDVIPIVCNEELYLFGRSGIGKDKVFVYREGRWTEKNDAPFLGKLVNGQADGKMIYFGTEGRNGNNGDILEYNTESDTWRVIMDGYFEQKDKYGFTLCNGHIYITGGGFGSSGDAVNYAEPYSYEWTYADYNKEKDAEDKNRIGHDYEPNGMDYDVKPEIKTVIYEVLDEKNGVYQLSMDEDYYICDEKASPFFFWESSSGCFDGANPNFSRVIFHADSESDEDVRISVGIGDGSGATYVAGFNLRR